MSKGDILIIYQTAVQFLKFFYEYVFTIKKSNNKIIIKTIMKIRTILNVLLQELAGINSKNSPTITIIAIAKITEIEITIFPIMYSSD